MRMFVKAGHKAADLLRLNKARIYFQVVFLSDVLGASGKLLDPRYIVRRPQNAKWSALNFPTEKPTLKDILFLAQSLQQLVPAEGLPDRLGRFQTEGPKIWQWRHDLDNNRLLHINSPTMDIYHSNQRHGLRSSTNIWSLTLAGQPANPCGKVCTVRRVNPTIVAIVSSADPPPVKTLPECFLAVLAEWGNTWLWKLL